MGMSLAKSFRAVVIWVGLILSSSWVFSDVLEVGLSKIGQLTGITGVTKVECNPDRDLLFLLSGSDVRVVRGATGEVIDTHAATETFTDMDLTHDGRYLFVADYGGERMGYGTPLAPHYVHRYDLQEEKWLIAQAPKIAWKIEAVASDRVLLQEHDQHVDMTLNSFGSTMTELSRIRADYYGDLEYDSDTQRAYHGSSGSSSREVHVRTVVEDTLVNSGDTGVYGTAQRGGGTCVLSTDGAHLYYGKLQIDAMNVRSNLYTFPEYIYAASPKIAFGKGSYYSAETGVLLKAWDFTCGAVGVSEDGRHVWAHDSASGTMHHYVDSTLLSVNLPSEATEGDGVLSMVGFLNVVTAPNSNLVVSLTSSDPLQVGVPESITLLVGETNVMFDVEILDDGDLDGSQPITISAEPSHDRGYPNAEGVIVVHDTESATLMVILPQTTFEGAGSIAGVVQSSVAPVKDVVIELSSNHSDKIESGRVVLPAGQTFASFSLVVIDNDKIDGIQTATVEARVENWTSGYASVFVFDNETSGIDLQLPASVWEGDATTNSGTITLSGSSSADVHVLLAGSDSSELIVPNYVTIPAGKTTASFDVVLPDDAETDGAQSVSVLAEAPGYVPSIRYVNVKDNDLHHFEVIMPNAAVDVTVPASIDFSAKNIDGLTLSNVAVPLNLSAFGDRGNVPVAPSVITNLISGVLSESIAFGKVDDNVVLVVDDGVGHSGTGSLFNVMGSVITLDPVAPTNTTVVAGETLTHTMAIYNTGNTNLNFVIYGIPLGRNSIVDASLVAHYPFNGDAADESGNGHDGSVTGAILTADRFGRPNAAYDFNGSSAFINCGNIINGFSSFTVSAWVNVNRFTDSAYMGPWGQQKFGYPNVNGNYHLLTASSTSSGFGTSMRWDDGTLLNSRIGHVLPLNQWHLITQTYDGNEVRQYDNGNLVNTTVTGAHTLSNSWDFLIGKTAGYPGYLSTEYFDGQIDDLRVYERALSEQEIISFYNEKDPAVSNDLTSGLIANFSFSGNADDESGNGYDGAVNGATLTADRFGKADSAYAFDGVDDYIDLGTMGGFKTVSMWVKQEVRDSYDFYFGHNDFRIFASTSGPSSLTLGDGSGYVRSSVLMDNYVGAWVHVVGVVGDSGFEIYVNGTQDVDFVSGSYGIPRDGEVNLGRWISNTHYFHGSLDDIQIYERALSVAEISALYGENNSGSTTNSDSWLTLDMASGTIPPGSNEVISISFDASDMIAGDYSNALLNIISNDALSPSNEVPASMWVLPSAPVMIAEPEHTEGASNEIAWGSIEGPVSYWVEQSLTTNAVPMADSGWITPTNYLFDGMVSNTVYQYRAKASVDTTIGRLEGAWSAWVGSRQVVSLSDFDGDGIPNWWEMMFFGGDASVDSTFDSDGDGQSNLAEYIAGMDPTNAASCFKVDSVDSATNGAFVLSWEAVTGRVYSVHWKNGMTNQFRPLRTGIRPPQNSYTDNDHSAENCGFYMIDVELDHSNTNSLPIP